MKLISWNVQWCRGCDGRVDPARIADTLDSMGPADVICLQEVSAGLAGLPGSDGEDQYAWLARRFRQYSAIYAPATDTGCGSFGNLLLSRLPVRRVWRHLLPWPAESGVPSMQRSCVEVLLDNHGEALRVLGTHLEYYSAHQRLAQADALRALQRRACRLALLPPLDKDSNPAFSAPRMSASAILCGDFNCEPASETYRRLQQPIGDSLPGWVDAWPLAHPGQVHAHSVGLHGADWPDRAYCCDFAFVSADLASRVIDCGIQADTDASDHQPLWLVIR